MNSDEMVKASISTLSRMKTIDELTRETQKIKAEISVKGQEIQNKACGLLKNMTPKKVVTDLKVRTRWAEQKIVFANYGIGIQSTHNSNATSLPEIEWENFIRALIILDQNQIAELPKYLKPEKLTILKKFLKNIGKLRIDREEQEHSINKEITYVSRDMLWKSEKKAVIGKAKYYRDKLSFDDDEGKNVSVSINNPRLEDALILEQIFDETKAILTKEIERLRGEKQNYDDFITELKKDFSNEMLLMELAK